MPNQVNNLLVRAQMHAGVAMAAPVHEVSFTTLTNVLRRTRQMPRFQRKFSAWSAAKKEGFILSLLSDIPITHGVFLSRQGDSQTWNVLDGQHRLTTIEEFIEGKFPIGPDRRTFAEFSEVEKVQFENKQIALHTIVGATPNQEIRIFYNLNQASAFKPGDYFNMVDLPEFPIVPYANVLLHDREHPVGRRFRAVFNIKGDPKSNSPLANMVAHVAGALYGPEYITKEFDRLQPCFERELDIPRAEAILNEMFDIWAIAAPRKDKSFGAKLGYINGYLLTDIFQHWETPEMDGVRARWIRFIRDCLANPMAYEQIKYGGGRGILRGRNALETHEFEAGVRRIRELYTETGEPIAQNQVVAEAPAEDSDDE